MAVNYVLVQDKRKEAKTSGLWYARTKMTGTVNLNSLATKIQRNCTAKKSDVMAVLTELIETMQDELQASHAVKLNGIGTFKIAMTSKPAEKASDFTVAKNVKKLRVTFSPEVHLSPNRTRTIAFLEGCSLKEAPVYKVDKKEEAEGDSGTTTGGNDGEGGNG